MRGWPPRAGFYRLMCSFIGNPLATLPYPIVQFFVMLLLLPRAATSVRLALVLPLCSTLSLTRTCCWWCSSLGWVLFLALLGLLEAVLSWICW